MLSNIIDPLKPKKKKENTWKKKKKLATSYEKYICYGFDFVMVFLFWLIIFYSIYINLLFLLLCSIFFFALFGNEQRWNLKQARKQLQVKQVQQ